MVSQSTHKTLSDAIEFGDTAAVHSLLDLHPELVNHATWTPPPLHCAVLWNQPQIAEILLDNGADIEMRDPDRNTTPLRYAIMFCKEELIPVLLSRGANTGSIVEGGTSARQLADEAATGKYDDYEDLPSREDYNGVVSLLEQLGIN